MSARLWRRLWRSRRRPGQVLVLMSTDLDGYIAEILKAQRDVVRRTVQLQRRQVDLAWIRRVAACELAAGRHRVQTLADAVYADLGLPNPRQEKS